MQQMLKTFTILIGIGFLLCGTGVWYYYGIFLPNEQVRLTEEKQIKAAKIEQQLMINKDKNTECVDRAKKFAQERWIKSCEWTKQEKNLQLQDCKKPSQLTWMRLFSDEWCESTYNYREESPGQCVSNNYGAWISSQLDSSIATCNKEFPIE